MQQEYVRKGQAEEWIKMEEKKENQKEKGEKIREDRKENKISIITILISPGYFVKLVTQQSMTSQQSERMLHASAKAKRESEREENKLYPCI